MELEKEARKRARNRERAAQRRAMETESERSHRLEASRRYSAEKRARESEEKKAERRMVDRKRAADRRARESEWEREQRLALGRQRAAERRAAESEEEREYRLAQNRERLASKRASKAENQTSSGQAVGNVDKAGQQPVFCNGVKHSLHKAELTSYPLQAEKLTLPAPTAAVPGPWLKEAAQLIPCPFRNGVEHPLQEAVLTRDPLPVDVVNVKSTVDMARVIQPQQLTAVATAEQTVTGNSVGAEKSEEFKQEIVEIKEFRAVESNLERHYNELLKVILEIGRDVKPAYTNNKVSTDRLRKNITMARGIVRECVQDVDRLAAVAATSTTSTSSI